MNKSIINAIRDYLVSTPIKRAWIFGSFSRGEERKDSDLDLLVEFLPDKKIGMTYFKILDDLQTLCRRKVDLVEEGMLDPKVVQFVDNDKRLIYERAN